MEPWKTFLMVVAIMAVLAGILFFISEKDPDYQLHRTTWGGQPAWGQLHRPDASGKQDYTFYKAGPNGEMGHLIATFPAAEAAKLH